METVVAYVWACVGILLSTHIVQSLKFGVLISELHIW